MSSIADSSVTIQTSSQSVPSTPCWFGEVTLIGVPVVGVSVSKPENCTLRFGYADPLKRK